jgi:hypothetical protein
MLFALIGLYKDHVEQELLEIRSDVNEYLGQPLLQTVLAAVLRNKDRRRIGNVVLVEAPTFAEAEVQLRYSPALNEGLYDRVEIGEIDIEIGDIKAD